MFIALALLGLTATQAMTEPAAASFDAKKLITIADVGSGGTRLIMFVKTDDGVSQCCKDTCSSENSPSVINLPGKSRYTGDMTFDKVKIFSKALFEDALVTLKDEAKDRCPELYDEIKDDSDGHRFKEIVTESSGVRILATAGARRNAVNDAVASSGRDIKAFNTVLVAGFQQMFKAEYGVEKPTHFADGSIMDGTYEAYFGLVEGFKTAKKTAESFDSKNAVYFEVGGASQQVGWFNENQQAVERFQHQSTMLRSAKSRGPMHMTYPTSNVADVKNLAPGGDASQIVAKNVFAASILGTGLDRFFVHLLLHAVRRAIHKGEQVATCPCLPSVEKDGEELNENQYTTLKWNAAEKRIEQSGIIFRSKKKDKDDQILDPVEYMYPNGITDSAEESEITDWLKVTGHKIIGKKADYMGCVRAIRHTFAENKDDVGGEKRTFHEQFAKWRLALQSATAEHGDINTIVYNSLALTGGGKGTVAGEKCGTLITYAQLVANAEQKCKWSADWYKATEVFSFPACAAGEFHIPVFSFNNYNLELNFPFISRSHVLHISFLLAHSLIFIV